MNQLTTQAIVLSRTNFGEADRIVTFLTPDRGKISGMVKGVRKPKSKLAGGIELFSVSDIGFIPGRGEVSTITSTRLVRHYGNIVRDLNRTNLGYELIKNLNKATEDSPEEAYFDLLNQAFGALNDDSIDLDIIAAWFDAQLLKQAGHTPNLHTDAEGVKLDAGGVYDFNFDSMCFQASQAGHASFKADHIKFLRLLFSGNPPMTLQKVQGASALAAAVRSLLRSMLANFVRL
ncbi:MAG TPA: DNA repair protein RecO [Candidatus Saccharimonadales bacterium]|nr:DNA repair protein RecO [Candidatus Saccharimonadales bacterium]